MAWWCAALAATISWVAFIVGVVVATGTQTAARTRTADGGRTVGRVVGWAVLAFAVPLIALQKIHGPPFLTDAILALVASRHRRRR